VILKAVSNGAGVRAGIDFKAVRDPIVVHDLVQFGGVEAQAVLVTGVHGDGAILL
jgi:hypothetical protein